MLPVCGASFTSVSQRASISVSSELVVQGRRSPSFRVLTDARVLECLSVDWSDAGANVPAAVFIASHGFSHVTLHAC